MPKNKLRKAIYLILLIIIVFISTKSVIFGANDLSRFATMKNLVENHSFVLVQEKAVSADTIMAEEELYSSKPPLLSVAGAGIYWVLHNMFNLNLPLDRFQESLAVYLINLIIVGGSLLLLTIFFYKSLAFYQSREKSKIFLCAVLVLATLVFTYSGTLNNHIPSAAFIFAGFYYLLKQTKKGFSSKHSLLAGLLLSIAFCLEPIFSGIFIFFILIYLLLEKEKRKYAKFFVLGLLPLAIFYAAINMIIIGSPLPPYFNKGLYKYSGSYWLWPHGIDAMHEPKIVYGFNLLIGSHGLFLYTPILFFSFYGIKKIIFNAQQEDIKKITILTVLAILSYILFLVFFTNNYGGTSYGARWFICFVPLLLFYLAVFYREIIHKHFNLFTTLLVFSIAFAWLGYIDPWFHNSLQINSTFYFPLLAKMMYFRDIVLNIIS